jgi:hypothetical protein
MHGLHGHEIIPQKELPLTTFRLVCSQSHPPVTPPSPPKVWGRPTPIAPEPNVNDLRPLPPAMPYRQ